uniref:Adenylate isopentenyltransferase 7, mitochondrial n=1 Tax=Solanum tuberosum TaxID=4113 RepID=M1DNG8_SOLTU
MVNAGLVDEVRQIFIPDAYYTKGILWSIGVPEMARYLKEEKNIYGHDESKKMILQASISSIKRNTRILICNELDKIQQLINKKMWSVHHIIATDVFKEDTKEVLDEAWKNTVLQPCLDILKRFLKNDDQNKSVLKLSLSLSCVIFSLGHFNF